jgi:hypothetical protein
MALLALGWQSGSSVGLARVAATLTASRFLAQRQPALPSINQG